MRSKWVRTAAFGVLAAILLATQCLAATIGGATVTASDVRLRSSADTSNNGNIITEMQKGTFLLVEEKLDGWYKVVFNGTEGYVSAEFAAFSESAEGTYLFDAATNGTDVNMRGDASTAASVVKRLAQKGSALTITGVCGQWLRVTDAAGAAGYIRSDLVDYRHGETAPAAAAGGTGSVTQSGGDGLVQTALQYQGYSYRWGGSSPSTGFDCSGFANYVCSQNGISLHRTAQEIYSNDGTAVSKDALQPGDLVFFGYGAYSVTHVGIYIGDGQMIHASTSATGVILSDINSNYYTRMYVGAKRVV